MQEFKDQMFIEIQGVQFENKGASLMLYAALQQIRSQIPKSQVVLAPGYGRPYSCRARTGAYQKLWFSVYGYQIGDYIGAIIPSPFRRLYGLVRHSEIDVVLDASGFAYGDPWGARRPEVMAKAARKLKKNGGTLVLMPQAMGPFECRRVRRSVKEILELSDLVFPRDEMSYQYVCDLVGESDRIIQSPDFTVLLNGIESNKAVALAGQYAIIPNKKMLSIDRSPDGGHYLALLARCIKALRKAGQNPYLLIHEGESDINLAHRLEDLTGISVEIVTVGDPLEVKGIIGSAGGVISSRYHGLVSALSQGVPALSTSWSHKYETLMEYYGCADSILDLDAGQDQIQMAIESIVRPGLRETRARILCEKSAMQKKQSTEMWKKVIQLIQQSGDAPEKSVAVYHE